MSSIKIAIKAAQLSDIKVKLKIEIENNTKSVCNLPQVINQDNICQPYEADSPAVNHIQTKLPEFALQSDSFWRKLFLRLNFWRRN